MRNWRPDFLSLRLFVAVCEEASISRAAEREAIVPSAVSKRIAEIEEATGVPLLVRSNRGVRPTAAGTAFLHHARQILLTMARLQGEMIDYAAGTRGHVRIAANVSSIVQFLPRDIASFMALHPDIRVDLEERVTPEVIDAVRDSQVDIGVALRQDVSEGLHQTAYEHDRLIALVPAGHPLAQRDAVAFEDTLDHGFVSTQPSASTTTFLIALASQYGRVMRYRMHVSSLEALCHIVAENLAIAIVAAGAVQQFVDMRRLRTITLTDRWAIREIVIYQRPDPTRDLVLNRLICHLHQQAELRRKRVSGQEV